MAELQPEHESLQASKEIAVRALHDAEQAMNEWQGNWEEFNRRAAEPSQQAQVERAKMESHERQITQLDQRMARLGEERNRIQSDDNDAELESLGRQVGDAEQAASEFQLKLDHGRDK